MFIKKNTTTQNLTEEHKNSEGFTLVELLVVLVIISVVTTMVLVSYPSFGSNSTLVARISEIEGYIRFAQERSGSAEPFDVGDDPFSTEGYQVAHLKVRDGVLDSFFLKKRSRRTIDWEKFVEDGDLSSDETANVNIDLGRFEEYFIDVCFIKKDSSYERKGLQDVDAENGNIIDATSCNVVETLNSQAKNFPMLCKEPDSNYSERAKNNFDIYFAIEQPTNEIKVGVVPEFDSGTPKYQSAEPAYELSDITYNGVRIAFITSKGIKRSIDLYRLGLITTRAEDADAGCGNAT